MPSVFEETNLSKAIWRVGLPAMLGQLTTLIYNMADTFFVSLTQQPAMIAAVTLCTPILLIIMSIACVFGMGGSCVIARLLGKWRKEDAGKILNLSTYAMRLPGLVTLGLGLACSPQLASIAGADAENMAYTCDYLLYIFLGAPFIMLSNGFVHLFRPVGLVKQNAGAWCWATRSTSCWITCSSFPWDGGPPAPPRPLPWAFCAPAPTICFACSPASAGEPLVPSFPALLMAGMRGRRGAWFPSAFLAR